MTRIFLIASRRCREICSGPIEISKGATRLTTNNRVVVERHALRRRNSNESEKKSDRNLPVRLLGELHPQPRPAHFKTAGGCWLLSRTAGPHHQGISSRYR